MKRISLFLIGLFLLLGVSAKADLNAAEAYFVRKSLNNETLKNMLLANAQGESLPIAISGVNDKKGNGLDSKCCNIKVKVMDISNDEVTNVATAHLVYLIGDKYEIDEEYTSSDLNNWNVVKMSIKVNTR